MLIYVCCINSISINILVSPSFYLSQSYVKPEKPAHDNKQQNTLETVTL